MEEVMSAKPMMSFGEAVKTCINKYATFRGRARRSEYWWFYLACFILSIAGSILAAFLAFAGVDYELANNGISLLILLAVFLPSLSVGVRRLHDIGRSGWWLLLGFIPFVGAIVLIVWFCQDSKLEANEYGESPKYE